MEKKELQKKGLRLLKRGRMGFFHVLFSRTGLITLLLLIQAGLLLLFFLTLRRYLPHVIVLQTVFVLVMVLYLLQSRQEASTKVTWLVFIMITPVFGTLFLLLTRTDLGHRVLRDEMRKQLELTRGTLSQDQETLAYMDESLPSTAALLHYLNNTGCFPAYAGCRCRYFPLGEDMFAELLPRLEQAEHSIFLEFFIIEEGEMWGAILELLAKKAAEGLDVRLIYDGSNEFFTLPRSYPEKLRALGIQTKVFAPLRPFLSTHYNYRDHRKILVIDGKTAVTGGVNLSDRYINRVQVYGHWKDTALMIEGEAARSFELMFLQNWNMGAETPDYSLLRAPAPEKSEVPGIVIPYSDSPLDRYRVGEMVYIDLLNRAERYVHIMTPYLILDGELETALRFAAERGVDVALILPGVPDKKGAYALAKTHYAALLASGVKLYEYSPGFVHAKVFVSDDQRAVVGTINLDYRSLYHHFECAAYLAACPCIADIEQDFIRTRELCREVSPEDLKKLPFKTKLDGVLLKAVDTMM